MKGKDPAEKQEEQPKEPFSIPITNELDLHTFRPSELNVLLPSYFEACRDKGIFQVRLIHGKGTGQLRERVHSILRKSVLVASFTLANSQFGGWGATVVTLKRPS